MFISTILVCLLSKNKILSSTHFKAEADLDKRLAKCEAAASELKKDVKKEKKKLEKLNNQIEASQKNQIDQKVIEETIQTILVDVVDELTENEARQFEVFDRRIKEIEEHNELAHQQHKISDKKTNTELRRLAAIVNTGIKGLTYSSSILKISYWIIISPYFYVLFEKQ